MKSETITFMGTHWILVEDSIITVGLHEDALETAAEISKIDFPTEGEEYEADDICAEVETDDGPINVFAPVSGVILEVNPELVENPGLLMEDPYTEGWIFKIEASNSDEVDTLITGRSLEQ
jgi:glycine cleavage system H protein